MKRIFFLFLTLLLLNCKKYLLQRKFIIASSFNQTSDEFINQFKKLNKEKYKLKIVTGNLFSLDKEIIKKEIKKLNKIQTDFYICTDEISETNLKIIKKYEKSCRFPILYSKIFKKNIFIFKTYYFLNLNKFRIFFFNQPDDLNIDFSQLTKVKFKKNDILFIFTNSKNFLDEKIKWNTFIITFVPVDLTERSNVFYINKVEEAIYECIVYYNTECKKIENIEIKKIFYSGGTSL